MHAHPQRPGHGMLVWRGTWWVLIGAAGSLTLAGPASGRQAAFRGIGFAPGDADSGAEAVSADGSTVVGWSTVLPAGTLRRAIRWTASAGVEPLGLLPGSVYAEAYGVSADGSVVVGECLVGGSPRAFRWTRATGMQEIVPGIARAVSADGSVVVGRAGANAFRWTAPGGPAILPLPPGWSSLEARAVSYDGDAIAGQGFAAGHPEAFRWTAAGGTQPLGLLPLGPNSMSFGQGISGDGHAVVGASNSLSFGSAFRWTAQTGMQALPIPPASQGPAANAVNGDGTIIGGLAYLGPGTEASACLWAPGPGAVVLPAYLPTLGVQLKGWTLSSVAGVSADGRTLAGRGRHTVGGQQRSEGWITVLPPVCYPDCTTDGSLTVADFGCFQTKFVAGDPYADCNADGALTVADFGCFQTGFVAGCP